MQEAGSTPPRLSEQAVIPLDTLDPAAPPTDLGWLDRAVGDARVVAIGESAHYNAEFYRLRHRLLRYLTERHGFTAYAMESGFPEGWMVDGWVRGSDTEETANAADAANANNAGDPLGRVLSGGMTSLMGLWAQMRDQLRWMREHNRTATRPVGFYGIDLPGSNVSLLPGLDAVIAYLAQADPAYAIDPDIREIAAGGAAASPFGMAQALTGYQELEPQKRDSLTAGVADLEARMTALRLDYVARTGIESYGRALRTLGLTRAQDAMVREVARGTVGGTMSSIRDAEIADTIEWILQREERIVVAAHNGHVQRSPVAFAGWPASTTMGMHLAERLGEDYLVIGTTNANGQTLNNSADFYSGALFTTMEPPRAGSLDALMAASHDGMFATDLRTLSPADTDVVRSVSEQLFGTFYTELDPLSAFDLVVHMPHVTAADPDQGALAHAPEEVQKPFGQWLAG